MKAPPAEDEPKKLRSSPTGRVPQWAMDEAIGRPTAPVPFRGPVAGRATAGLKRLRRRSTVRTVGAVLAAVGVGAGALYLQNAAPGADGPAFSASAAANNAWPPPGRDEQSAPLGSPPAGAPTHAVEGAGFRFLSHQTGKTTPVTWSPCRPVRYVIRPLYEPVGGAGAIASALAELGHATGLKFVDAGTTTEGPTDDRAAYLPARYGKRWAPVLIVWASTAEVPDFGIDVAGEAGPYPMPTPDGGRTYVSGTVSLDPRKFTEIVASDGYPTAKVVILHELGHLVGLAHVTDPNQVMFPRVSARVTTYGPGDLDGLAALGRGRCEPDV